jgi:hypothetical protein
MRCLIAAALAASLLPASMTFGAEPLPSQAVPPAKSDEGLTAEQRQWVAKAWRHEKDGWVFLHIEGSPQARGFQHGYLLAREIESTLAATRKVWNYESGMEWSWLVEQAGRIWRGKIDDENLAEIDGIVSGLAAARVAASRNELIAHNGIVELAAYWWPTAKEKLKSQAPTRPREACSAFIATGSATRGGGIVMGHNTMGGYADNDCNFVLDIAPEKGHRILMQSYPGWIHSGTDFFITDAGLIGCETTISGFKGFDESGRPEFSRMRSAAQTAASIEQWCSVMKQGNNGGYANAWLLGDVRSGEIARLELGLRQVAFEKKRDGYFIGANVAEDLKLLRLETSVDETDIRLSAAARRVRWKQLMGQHAGRIDIELARVLLADHYDVFREQDAPGERSLCKHGELEKDPPGGHTPYEPNGTLDAKVVDSAMAKEMSFAARWGSACGTAFDADQFLKAHPQFDWMQGILKSRPARPWTIFRSGETAVGK